MEPKHKNKVEEVKRILKRLDDFNAPASKANYGLKIGNQIANLICHFQFGSLNRQQRGSYCNGMGPDGLLGIMIPENFHGLCLTICGDIHDWDFTIGPYMPGGGQMMEYYNLVFLYNMVQLIDAQRLHDMRMARKRFGWWKFLFGAVRNEIEDEHRDRLFLAVVYFKAVNHFGKEFYGSDNAEKVARRYLDYRRGDAPFYEV